MTDIGDATEQTITPALGVIKNVGTLDLLSMHMPDELAGITRLEAVGAILVPEPLLARLLTIPMERVGTVVPVPAGDNVRVVTGQMRTTGDALANVGGDPGDILFVVGQLLLSTPVQTVGYAKLVVTGQVLAPYGSEAALTSGITRLLGQVVYHAPNARIMFGQEQVTADFFALLAEATQLVIVGTLRLEDDVTADLLRARVQSIILFGTLIGPRPLIPMLQFLTTEKFGAILAADDVASQEDAAAPGDD